MFIHMQKNEDGLIPYTKLNSKWIKNIRAKTIKLLEENRGRPSYSDFGSDFLDMTPGN